MYYPSVVPIVVLKKWKLKEVVFFTGESHNSCVVCAGLMVIKERISGLSSELREPTSSAKLKRQKEHESTPVEARH